MTTLVHGEQETQQAKAAAAALFGGGDLHELSTSTLGAALREAGAARVTGELPGVVDLLVETGLVASRSEARRTIGEGGAYLNNARVEDPELVPGEADLIGGEWLVLRRGQEALRRRPGAAPLRVSDTPDTQGWTGESGSDLRKCVGEPGHSRADLARGGRVA